MLPWQPEFQSDLPKKPYAVFPPSQWWYTWNLIKIVHVALEIYVFEIPLDPNAKTDKGR